MRLDQFSVVITFIMFSQALKAEEPRVTALGRSECRTGYSLLVSSSGSVCEPNIKIKNDSSCDGKFVEKIGLMESCLRSKDQLSCIELAGLSAASTIGGKYWAARKVSLLKLKEEPKIARLSELHQRLRRNLQLESQLNAFISERTAILTKGDRYTLNPEIEHEAKIIQEIRNEISKGDRGQLAEVARAFKELWFGTDTHKGKFKMSALFHEAIVRDAQKGLEEVFPGTERSFKEGEKSISQQFGTSSSDNQKRIDELRREISQLNKDPSKSRSLDLKTAELAKLTANEDSRRQSFDRKIQELIESRPEFKIYDKLRFQAFTEKANQEILDLAQTKKKQLQQAEINTPKSAMRTGLMSGLLLDVAEQSAAMMQESKLTNCAVALKLGPEEVVALSEIDWQGRGIAENCESLMPNSISRALQIDRQANGFVSEGMCAIAKRASKNFERQLESASAVSMNSSNEFVCKDPSPDSKMSVHVPKGADNKLNWQAAEAYYEDRPYPGGNAQFRSSFFVAGSMKSYSFDSEKIWLQHFDSCNHGSGVNAFFCSCVVASAMYEGDIDLSVLNASALRSPLSTKPLPESTSSQR